ncbi:hypothetical protein J0895_06730, partial [Phormidium pseudopriestleyi FRX01]
PELRTMSSDHPCMETGPTSVRVNSRYSVTPTLQSTITGDLAYAKSPGPHPNPDLAKVREPEGGDRPCS